MTVKWIIADLDGCITAEESAAWDLEPLARLAESSREASAGRGTHAPLTICTGRPQPYVEVLMKILDIRAPAICENGAVLYTLHDNRAWYGPGVTEEKILGMRAVRAYLEADVLPAHPGVLLQFGKEAQISVFSEQPDRLAPVRRCVEEFVARAGGPDLCLTASYYYLNVSLAGVDKGNALRALMRELHVTRDEVAGIGDTEGDFPLREAVGFFACPANARPALKQTADYVSPYPLTEGVLDILTRPELRREP